MMLPIMMLLILMMITDDSETLLPQYGVSQEVPFSAFEFLSCASCKNGMKIVSWTLCLLTKMPIVVYENDVNKKCNRLSFGLCLMFWQKGWQWRCQVSWSLPKFGLGASSGRTCLIFVSPVGRFLIAHTGSLYSIRHNRYIMGHFLQKDKVKIYTVFKCLYTIQSHHDLE